MATKIVDGIKCLTCGEMCGDYTELAHHITRKKHMKGRRWAAKYLLTAKLSPKAKHGKFKDRIPATEAEKNSRKVRELSGIMETVMTYCPRCSSACRQPVPVEFTQSPHAWRTGNGTLVMGCPSCRAGA